MTPSEKAWSLLFGGAMFGCTLVLLLVHFTLPDKATDEDMGAFKDPNEISKCQNSFNAIFRIK